MNAIMPKFPVPGTNRTRLAYTLTELMVTMAIFSLLVVAVLSANMTGMKMRIIADTKLSATASARRALNAIRYQAMCARMMQVGNGNATTFIAITNPLPKQGNALQVYPTTDTNQYVRFYLDQENEQLMRLNSDELEPEVIAPYVTNRIVFVAEDFKGNVLTNDLNNYVIRMQLDFYKWEFPIATAGSGALYEYFRLQTRMTRRAIE